MAVYKRGQVWWYRFTWKGEAIGRVKQSNKRVAEQIEAAHTTSLAEGRSGIRDSQRGQIPLKPRDPFLLRDVGVILIDCGIRPEECFRLRWENDQDGVIEITHGKTDNARQRIPLSPRAQSVLNMRRSAMEGPWMFPAPTKSAHIEPSSLQGQHTRACKLAKLEHFPIYTFRHTGLTRWAPFMDPWTLTYLAGHRDMSITKLYVHPQEYSTRSAIGKGPRGFEWAQFWAHTDSEHGIIDRQSASK